MPGFFEEWIGRSKKRGVRRKAGPTVGLGKERMIHEIRA